MFPEDANKDYFTFDIGLIEPTAWVTWPNHYKFIDLEIYVGADFTVTSRRTYDFLAFLSDVGGLYGVLQMIGGIFVGWFAKFNLESYMMSRLHLQSTPVEATNTSAEIIKDF